jgi:putative peptide zinc metalloprotease protein
VDSSDLWTAGRWPRVAVSLAGPYVNFLLAAVASIAAWLSPNIVVAAGLWQFALLSGIIALVNLNPLLEYDGYFILSDALDRPNLRQRSLQWLGQQLPHALRDPRELRLHWFELLYGLSSIGFVGLMAISAVVTYRVLLEVHLRKVLPSIVASGLPWVLVGLLVLAACIRIVEELRIIPSPKRDK